MPPRSRNLAKMVPRRRQARAAIAMLLALASLVPCSRPVAAATSDPISSARLLADSQGHLLHVERVAVRVTSARAMRLRLAVIAVETIPGRAAGPRHTLTRERSIAVRPHRSLTMRLPLTRRGVAATRTCARYRLSLWVRTRSSRKGRLVALGPTTRDSARCQCFFAPDGVWNRRLGASDPIDRRSARLVAKLKQQIDEAVGKRYWPTINTNQYSTPVYEVPENQRRVRVTLDDRAAYRDTLRKAFRSVPVPDDARPAQGTDRHMVVWQPSRDTMWEFWLMRRAGGGWHAQLGGKMTHVSRNPGYFDGPLGSPWGATATSLPLLGGLIFPHELARGRIDHALAIALPRTRRAVWSLPAQRQDGSDPDPTAIPQGTRFRIDPRFDIDSLHLPRAMRAIAVAAQRYGIIVRDTAGTPVLYAEDPTPLGANPYPALFENKPLGPLLARLPWANMQAMRLQLRTYAQ